MFSPNQAGSPRSNTIKTNLPYITSPKHSQSNNPSLPYENLERADFILCHEKSIVKQNIDRLKSLLSEKKEFNRRHREDLSPEIITKSPLRDKENFYTPQKGQFRPNTLNQTPDRFQQSLISGLKGRAENANLITDIKRKIVGSPTSYSQKLAEGRFTKGIISPQTVSLYSDNHIQLNKYLRKLVQQNGNLETQILQKNHHIAQQDAIIDELEQKLQQFVLDAQKKQQKIHSILFQKDSEIQCLKLQKEQEINKIKNEVENIKKTLIEQFVSFQSGYHSKIQTLFQTFSSKVKKQKAQLQKIHSAKILKLKKQIQLQKSIFIPQKSYRKTKNVLQMSPSITGDSVAQHEDQIQKIERQMLQFESEIQYKKDKYEEMIQEYETKYKELEKMFLESQKKNQALKRDILLLKEQQTKFMQEYKEKLERKQQFERQHLLSDIEQTIEKGTPKSISVQAPSKSPFFNKQQSPKKVQKGGYMTPRNKRDQNIEESIQEKDSESLQKNTYLSMKLKKQEKESDKGSQFGEISRILSKKEEPVNMRELQEKVEMELRERRSLMRKEDDEKRSVQKQMELERKEREFAERVRVKERQLQIREARIQQQARLQQLYMQEMQNIKSMVRLMEQAQLKVKPSGEESKILDTSKDHQQKRSTTPKKLKQISKVEYLAKKQRKEKQIAKTRLESLERQLMLERNKNIKIQRLIGETEKDLFGQVRERVARKDTSKLMLESDSESVINEEESPFDPRLQNLARTSRNIEESKKSAEWQHRVKMRLEDAVTRLETLEMKCSQRN